MYCTSTASTVNADPTQLNPTAKHHFINMQKGSLYPSILYICSHIIIVISQVLRLLCLGLELCSPPRPLVS